jgi:hypothetical protein
MRVAGLALGNEKSTKTTAEFLNQKKRVGVGDASGGLDHNGAVDTLVTLQAGEGRSESYVP